MASTSKIEWTRGDDGSPGATWNPITGCTKISPGCAHCYIERTPPMRIAGCKFVKGQIQVQLHYDRLDAPLRWHKPRRIFVNSMSDLFHNDVPFEFILQVCNVMADLRCEQHTFQVLTKRPQRMLDFFAWAGEHAPGDSPFSLTMEAHGFLPNVWWGVSVEDQQRADERIPLLLRTPAAVRFLSCEPLLSDIHFQHIDIRAEASDYETLNPLTGSMRGPRAVCGGSDRRINWIIVGGESGPGARPMHPEWARSIRDQCQEAGVPFFFKQWGEWIMVDKTMIRIGKTAAGRLLDGREWNEFPETVHT